MGQPSRRSFLKRAGAALAALVLGRGSVLSGKAFGAPSAAFAGSGFAGGTGSVVAPFLRTGRGLQVPPGRPPVGERRFSSRAVEAAIRETKAAIPNPDLAALFENCFPNTLDTTVEHGTLDGKPDTFVITGDIEAMWLRDSGAQVWPYLPFAKQDDALRRLLAGVIHRQTRCILIDPYANAFNREATGSEWESDLTEMKPELHERKWEVDSLCYPIRLAHGYWKATGDTSVFDSDWREAMRLVLRTFREQQRKDGHGPYRFQRVTARQTDTMAGDGWGNPIRPVGLIASAFRPSDDATTFLFLVPSNLFAVRTLRRLAEVSRDVTHDAAFAAECDALADQVDAALLQHAVVEHPVHGRVWAYEVDGFGNRLHMDDANVPSLLALPYLACFERNDPLYLRTRALCLGPDNPWFFQGSAAEGVGSPHTGYDRVWPMAITMRALTSTDSAEVRACLRTLLAGHAGTGFMHESFMVDDPSVFTRAWFAWANGLFGELVMRVRAERPGVLDG